MRGAKSRRASCRLRPVRKSNRQVISGRAGAIVPCAVAPPAIGGSDYVGPLHPERVRRGRLRLATIQAWRHAFDAGPVTSGEDHFTNCPWKSRASAHCPGSRGTTKQGPMPRATHRDFCRRLIGLGHPGRRRPYKVEVCPTLSIRPRPKNCASGLPAQPRRSGPLNFLAPTRSA